MESGSTRRIQVRGLAGEDIGYLKDQQNWWFDPAFPHAFELFDLDGFYEDRYFAADHVARQVVIGVVDRLQQTASAILGRPLGSVLEAGCGGGWFTEELFGRGIDVQAIEGSHAGVARTLSRGVPVGRVLRHDLRRPLSLTRQFDIAMCTEVAEHIECPFSGELVQTLVDHSRIVWFSFESPGTNEAHYHHSNEQPPKFWINLFRFHGYRAYELPAALVQALDARGRFLFIHESLAVPASLGKALGADSDAISRGDAMQQPHAPHRDWRWFVHGVTPPFLLSVLRRLGEERGRYIKKGGPSGPPSRSIPR